MKHSERIVRTLLCEKTDRAPFSAWLGFAPWGQTAERWKQEGGAADIWGFFGFEPFFAGVPLEYGAFPHFPSQEVSRDDAFVVTTDSRGLTMRNRLDGMSMPEWIGHPVKSRSDWDRYKAERLQPRLEERASRLAALVESMRGADVAIQVGSFPWGMYGTIRDLLGAEESLLSFYDDPDMVHDMMDTLTTLWLGLYEQVAAQIHIHHIHIWEDMSGKQGSLISPALMEEFMMPCYDRIAAFAVRHGVEIVSVDSDGKVDEVVAVVARHGVNAFMPFEVQAGSDAEEFGRNYPKLGLMGGLDKRALAAGKREMHGELDRAERLLARGGWIPGFDHLIPPDVPWANYRYFVEHLKRIIGV
jgi:uroporphyrinogen decarboxylase